MVETIREFLLTRRKRKRFLISDVANHAVVVAQYPS
jgi:hypothetical protein